MLFYDREEKQLEIPNEIFSKENQISHGNCGGVYYYGTNSCIKYYNQEHNYYFNRLDDSLYDILNDINNESLVNIKNYLTLKRKNSKADAYIMDYYKPYPLDILELPNEYLLNSVYNLYAISKTLSVKNIRFNDIKIKNLITTADSIVLIDPDRWEYEGMIGCREIHNNNDIDINAVLNNLVSSYLTKFHLEDLQRKNLTVDYAASKLFKLTSAKREMKVLTKRLEGCTKTIDYIYKL